jgi:hypothetical protein
MRLECLDCSALVLGFQDIGSSIADNFLCTIGRKGLFRYFLNIYFLF